jgi:hypothetical protein
LQSFSLFVGGCYLSFLSFLLILLGTLQEQGSPPLKTSIATTIISRGDQVTPYPKVSVVYERSTIDNPGDDVFEDLFLDDLWVVPYPGLSWMINIPMRGWSC